MIIEVVLENLTLKIEEILSGHALENHLNLPLFYLETSIFFQKMEFLLKWFERFSQMQVLKVRLQKKAISHS